MKSATELPKRAAIIGLLILGLGVPSFLSSCGFIRALTGTVKEAERGAKAGRQAAEATRDLVSDLKPYAIGIAGTMLALLTAKKGRAVYLRRKNGG